MAFPHSTHAPLLKQVALACLVLLGMSSSLSLAQTANIGASPASPSTPTFVIRGFEIRGENPLSAEQTSAVLAPFLRHDATIETLQKATAALEAALRDAGYGLHRVALPPQEVGRNVALEIVKFTIGRVVVTGHKHYDDANIRASLPELEEGRSPNFKRLAVQISLANENPSKQISIALKESLESDKIDATVEVRDARPWFGSVTLNNNGNASSGRDRLTLSAGHSNLWNKDHQAVLAYTTSVERPQDVRQWGLNYKIPFYRVGSTLGISASKSDVLGTFATFTSTGVGNTFGLHYTISLEPEGGRRSFLHLSLEDKLYRAALINGLAVGVDRRSRPISLGYSARHESNLSVWSYNLEASVNTSGGRANDALSYSSEYSNPLTGQGINSSAFRLLRGGFQYATDLPKNWQLSWRNQAQWANTALIAGEQIGLGGTGSLRGAPDRAITGDSGLTTSLELTSPELAKGLRLLTFVEAGWLSNRSADGQRRVSSDHLASFGLGVRFSHPSGVSFSADYGRLLNSSKLPLTTNSSAPQKGDDKLHLTLSVRF